MELKMEVYDAALTLLGILETYDAVIIDDRAFQPGSFSLESIADSTTVPLLRPGHIIWLEGQTAGVIECVQAARSGAGQTLSVRGCLLAGLLGRRILWGMYNLSGSPPQLMYDMVQDCAITPTRGDAAQRVLPNLVLDGAPPADARTVRKQSTGAALTSFLTELAQANQVAYGVRFDPAAPQMAFWARVGVDRTVGQSAVDPVLLSTELDDVLSAEYAYEESGFRNVALVAGEGEGTERKTKMVMVGGGKDGLPEGYIRLEYIESTGQEYINTGVRPSADLTVNIVFTPKKDGYDNRSVFGAAWAVNGFMLDVLQQGQVIFLSGGGSQIAQTETMEKIEVTCSQAMLVVNGIEYSMAGGMADVDSPIYLFWVGNCAYPDNRGKLFLYRCEIVENGTAIRDFVPCKNPSGSIGLYDMVTEEFFDNIGDGEFIGGSEIVGNMNAPRGMLRRETFVDARDLQSAADPDAPLTDGEYQAALATRGQEALADAPLVQSFSASVRTRDATYRYGEDFLLGDTITVTDERLGLSVSAVVEGVERSVGRTGEDMVLTLGYGLPTLSDRLRKAGV